MVLGIVMLNNTLSVGWRLAIANQLTPHKNDSFYF